MESISFQNRYTDSTIVEDSKMRVKAFHHVCIQTEDYEASLNFYVNFLGFEVKKVNKNFHGRNYNTWLEMPHMMIELQTPKNGESFRNWSKLNSGPVHLAFVVENVEAMYFNFKNKGYSRFKVKHGQEVYRVNEDTLLFKVIAPEGTEIEMRNNIGI